MGPPSLVARFRIQGALSPWAGAGWHATLTRGCALEVISGLELLQNVTHTQEFDFHIVVDAVV